MARVTGVTAGNREIPQENRNGDVRKRNLARRKCRLEIVRRKRVSVSGFLGGMGSAWVAQLVERVLGKDEVTGSIPVVGSRNLLPAGVTQW